jgi:dipeptidyl aminopeptidase/acylaminoacyl peptidase
MTPPLLLAALLALAAPPPPPLPAPTREVGQLVLDGIPPIPREISERLGQYQNVRAATLFAWPPSGRGLLVGTRFSDTMQAHLVAAPGAMRRQLTFYAEPVRSAFYDRQAGDGGLVLQMDVGGGEFYQYWWLELATGRRTLLTDGASRNESALPAPTGGRFAFLSTRRNKVDFDLWMYEGVAPAGTARLVKELPGQWMILDWSPDESRLLLQRYVSINESYLHVLELGSGTLTELNPRDVAKAGPVAYGGGAFLSNDAVVATSDEGGEFLQLTRFELGAGTRTVLRPNAAWDVAQLAVSPDRRWLAWAVDAGGTSELWLGPAGDAAKATRVPLPTGVISRLRFDAASTRLALSTNGAASTEDAWVLDLESRGLVPWTFSELGGLDPRTFVSPSLVEYPSFDGRKIPAWYYRPKSAAPDRKAPVVIVVHGGPEAQSVATFNPTAQYWANELGAAVLLPNVRGSAGYGKSYLKLDNGLKRSDSVRDLGALLDWIGTQPELDPARVAVFGGSYGGFMVLAAMTTYPERVKCGVDIVGISHFVTFLEKTEAYRRDLRRAEYGDERDPGMRRFLAAISPLTNASRIVRPLFVAQGKNDPRVPVGEAEQIVRTVRAGGTPVWYLLAKDEGHGFAKKVNRDAFIEATSLFFETYLLK